MEHSVTSYFGGEWYWEPGNTSCSRHHFKLLHVYFRLRVKRSVFLNQSLNNWNNNLDLKKNNHNKSCFQRQTIANYESYYTTDKINPRLILTSPTLPKSLFFAPRSLKRWWYKKSSKATDKSQHPRKWETDYLLNEQPELRMFYEYHDMGE